MTGGSISDADELTILEDSRCIEGDCVESDSVDADCKKLDVALETLFIPGSSSLDKVSLSSPFKNHGAAMIEATTTGNTNFIFKIFGDATYKYV